MGCIIWKFFFNMWNSFNVTTFKTKRALRYSLVRVRSERFATNCKLHVKAVTLKLKADIDTVPASFPTRHTGWPTLIYLVKTYYFWFALQKNKLLGRRFEVDAEKGRRPNLKSRNLRCFNLFAVGIRLHTGNTLCSWYTLIFFVLFFLFSPGLLYVLHVSNKLKFIMLCSRLSVTHTICLRFHFLVSRPVMGVI